MDEAFEIGLLSDFEKLSDFEDINSRASGTDKVDVDEDTRTEFEEKSVYPALEIAYLAVDKRYQRKHLGKAIIDEIVRHAKEQTLAGCVFLTVRAYHTEEYSALRFYQKCRFAKLSPTPKGEVWPMYKTLWGDGR